MTKSVFTRQYTQLRVALTAGRKARHLSQAALASKIGRPQSFVSKYERGERRLDAVELVQVANVLDLDVTGRCCTARSKSLTSLCRLQSHPAQYVSGIPSAAILLSISHPIRCSTRCLANVRARISGPMIAL